MAAPLVIGVNLVVKNIRSKTALMGRRYALGVKKAGDFLLAESRKEVPFEYGPLWSSGYSKVVGEGLKARAEVGYTEPYALYVHELVDMVLEGEPRPSGVGVYWGQHGRPANAKFLERPMRRLKPAMLTIIRKELRRAFSQGLV